MRVIRIVLLLLVGCAHTNLANADTLSHWSVYYNDSLMLYANVSDSAELHLRAERLEPLDVLTIRYFRDTPCPNCPVEVLIRKESGELVTLGEGRGTLAPVRFGVYQLLGYSTARDGTRRFQVYFREAGQTTQDIFLFHLQLE